jgi:3-oxoacyl-[acyl-carrier-protein] synthase II
VRMIFCPERKEILVTALHDFLSINNVSVQDVDVLVSGVSGDRHHDKLIDELVLTDFSQVPELRFKHLCGEYCTASSFGLWLAASVLKKQEIPVGVQFNTVVPKFPINTILLVNQYMGRNYSFILLKGIST